MKKQVTQPTRRASVAQSRRAVAGASSGLWILFVLLVVAPVVGAQEDEDSAVLSPVAYERELAANDKESEDLLGHYRETLDGEEANATRLIRALEHVGTKKETQDIARIVRFIDDLEPSVATAAMEALRAFGREALAAVKELPPGQIDPAKREEVTRMLLKVHVVECCERDRAVNPFQLPYKGRFDELYSVDADVDGLLIELLRESISDVRDDIAGNRYYYYSGYYPGAERPFVDYGGLAVAALAEREPDKLMEEVSDLAEPERGNSYYYWGYNSRTPVTIQIAAFLARNDKPALIDRFINEMESSMRWNRNDELAVQSRIAALQVIALGEYEAALDRLTENIKTAGSALTSMVTQANYLRARILMHLGEDGAALHALEDSMEASDQPMLLTLVDGSFDNLKSERRFQTILEYCRLAARRVSEIQRPYGLEEED